MYSSLSRSLHSLSDWRATNDRAAGALARWLQEHDLLGEGERALVTALRERLAAERVHVAFVAEFSRGKSELINAIFFADAGRRVMPATPGRTTMCPVELAWNPQQPPRLSLLPIETRLRGLTLAELRGREEPWTHVPLDPADPEALAAALAQVTRTQRATLDEARALGLWHDEQPDDNPPQAEDGSVEVPAWRHAQINYPHPMLREGLVVLDTPGLNAIGAEPELTLSLLPSAHAVVFVLGADTGVTKSDLAVWREHLGARALERFVVLNKIDALADPLSSPGDVERHIAQQQAETARQLGVAPGRVFPLSARDALTARIGRDVEALVRSRLPDLEAALSNDLMPRQRELLGAAVQETMATLRTAASRRLGDQRRQNAEELLELRGLRGKSGVKVRQMHMRVEAENADFERCIGRLQALRAVHQRMLKQATAPLSSDLLRREVAAMQSGGGLSILPGAMARSFAIFSQRMRAALARAARETEEMRQMFDASFEQLNAEFGFSFVLAPPPDLSVYGRELDLIESRYGEHLRLTRAWRLAAPGAAEQFRRMLLSKLRVVFESASGAIELWTKAAEHQVEAQLKERRRTYARRQESLERIQAAAGELEARIADLEDQDRRLRERQTRLESLMSACEEAARFGNEARPRRDAA